MFYYLNLIQMGHLYIPFCARMHSFVLNLQSTLCKNEGVTFHGQPKQNY